MAHERTIRSRVQGKIVIFLDMNAWIDLVDKDTPELARAREFLESIVDAGWAVCPVSQPTIWELFKQCADSAIRVGRYMDRLGMGVSFSPRKAIQRAEIVNYFNAIMTARLDPAPAISDVFAPVAVHFVGGGTIERLSPGGWETEPWGRAQDALGLLDDRRAAFDLTLCDFIRMQSHHLPVTDDSATDADYQGVRLRRRKSAGKDWEKHRRIEEEYIVKTRVWPLITDLCAGIKNLHMDMRSAEMFPLQAIRVLSRIRSRDKDKYGGLAKDIQVSARAIRAEIDAHAATGRDPGRKHKVSDFYDIEMLIVPRAYSRVLVSRDKWVRSLMEGPLGNPELTYV